MQGRISSTHLLLGTCLAPGNEAPTALSPSPLLPSPAPIPSVPLPPMCSLLASVFDVIFLQGFYNTDLRHLSYRSVPAIPGRWAVFVMPHFDAL